MLILLSAQVGKYQNDIDSGSSVDILLSTLLIILSIIVLAMFVGEVFKHVRTQLREMQRKQLLTAKLQSMGTTVTADDADAGSSVKVESENSIRSLAALKAEGAAPHTDRQKSIRSLASAGIEME